MGKTFLEVGQKKNIHVNNEQTQNVRKMGKTFLEEGKKKVFVWTMSIPSERVSRSSFSTDRMYKWFQCSFYNLSMQFTNWWLEIPVTTQNRNIIDVFKTLKVGIPAHFSTFSQFSHKTPLDLRPSLFWQEFSYPCLNIWADFVERFQCQDLYMHLPQVDWTAYGAELDT